MKKVLFLLPILTALFTFSGCSDDEEGGISLNESEITLYSDDTEQLEANDNVDWMSESEFVASVDANGLVTGNHVGTTNIIASNGSGTSKCTVEIIPRFNTFEEPVLDFGATKEEVKSKESRTILSETEEGLVYIGENNALDMVAYLFENGRLRSAGAAVSFAYTSELTSFLIERYQVVGEENDIYMFINNDVDKFDMIVSLSVESDYLLVAYGPYSTDTKVITETNDYINLKNEVKKIFDARK